MEHLVNAVATFAAKVLGAAGGEQAEIVAFDRETAKVTGRVCHLTHVVC